MGHLRARRYIHDFMTTCRTLYAHGFPYFLKTRFVISSMTQLESFLTLMSSESTLHNLKTASRYQCLRSLTFDDYTDWDCEPSISAIVDILESAKNLEELVLDGDAILKDRPKALQAVLGLTRLRSVSIHDCADRTFEWLKSTKSPISALDLSFFEPIPLDLAQLHSQLVVLDLTIPDISIHQAPFPCVQELALSTDDFVPAALLVRVFPKLKSLAISVGDYHHFDSASMLHESNKADLASSTLSLYPLESLMATSNYLYLSAFMPKVKRFMLEVYEAYPFIETFSEVLPFVQLSELCIPIAISSREKSTSQLQRLKHILEVVASTCPPLQLLELEITAPSNQAEDQECKWMMVRRLGLYLALILLNKIYPNDVNIATLC